MNSNGDRAELAAFLRARRDGLQPTDVGLARGLRRRTPGLRREEVAQLCDMSADYLARLERGTGPHPSEQLLAAIARGMRLTLDERDHLFLLCGFRGSGRGVRAAHVGPGLMRILDRLADTPAQIMGPLGQTLVQTPPAVALLGDETSHVGPARSAVHRWFTDPRSRDRYLPEDHELTGRVNVALLRGALTRDGPRSPAARLVLSLRKASGEFANLWDRQEIGVRFSGQKRFVHPEVGRIDLFCQALLEPDQAHSLLVFTATPGSESQEKLSLLAVLGNERLPPSPSRPAALT